MSYYWSEPVSRAGPTARDLALDEQLHQTLVNHDFFESEAESLNKEIALGKISEVVREWIRAVTINKGFSEQAAAEAGGKVYTLGSYRLGINQKGADIDTLILAPKHILREDFFDDLYNMLLARPEVTKLTKVPDAHTPIMNMIFSNVEIDLLFATLNLSSIPDDINLSDVNLLRNMDDAGIRSLNGPRVADELLKLVPNPQTFIGALCAIKFWAQRRGIYANIMGYLGGVAWALMTARICQLYPNAASSTIVCKFFYVYSDWRWPNPVCLKPIEEGPLALPVWNPRTNLHDRAHLMPVITPAYPSMNSTYNVTMSTFEVMNAEFKRGLEIVKRIEKGEADFEELFAKSDFFTRYKHYLQLTASATSEEDHRVWTGFVESRLRSLVQLCERTPPVTFATPFPRSYSHIEPATISSPPIHHTTFFLGLVIAKPPPGTKAVVNMFEVVNRFTMMVMQYRSRTDGMTIKLTHVPASGLPDYVFEPGQRAPRRKRAKASTPSEEGDAKRTRSSGEIVAEQAGRSSDALARAPSQSDVAATTSASSPAKAPASQSTGEQKQQQEQQQQLAAAAPTQAV